MRSDPRTSTIAGTKLLLWVVVAVLALTRVASAVTITSYAPTIYDPDTAAMDAALGITGYTIEMFDDVNLESGLTIGLVGATPTLTLTAGDLLDFANTRSDSANTLVDAFDLENDTVSFNFNSSGSGATSVGIGISQVNDINPIRLLVNGTDFGRVADLENLAVSNNGRSVYVRLTQESPIETISTIAFVRESTGPQEGYQWDHVAFTFSPVPEPSGFILGSFALLGIAGYFCARGRAARRDTFYNGKRLAG